MIDFQNDGLEHQVYELISKMCDLACSDEFPHFHTKQLENGRWECNISIPGVKQTASSNGKTEVEAINYCALYMLHILKTEHDKDQYDPDIEESLFRGNIEQFFGDVDYDKEYRYRLCETDILLNRHIDTTHKVLISYAKNTIDNLHKNGEVIDAMSDIVTLRFLVKEKKKNYC